jgi:LuxR family maltose regulon positive regulatory protein
MMFHRQSGNLDNENAKMRECMPYYYQVVDGHGNGAEHVMQGETDFLLGKLTDAEISYHLGASAARRKQQYSILVTAEILTMRMALFEGKYNRMTEHLEQLRQTLKQRKQYILLNTLDIGEAWLYALLGHPEETQSWVLSDNATAMVMYPSTPMLQTVVNQVLLAQGEWTKVIARGDELAVFFEKNHTVLCTVYLHIQLAIAMKNLQRYGDATRELHLALNLALPDGLLVPFAECGEGLVELLEKLQDEGVYQTEIQDILALSSKFTASKQTILREHWHETLDYGLTERELEIAKLAAQRKTNQEIAEALYLSQHTVKNHLKHIFDKLELTGEARNKRTRLVEIINPLNQSQTK